MTESTTDHRQWLPTTAYAALGLLAEGGEHTAYELKQRADRGIAHFYWAPAMSAVYTELARLGRLQLVAHRLEAEGEGRERRLYRITPPGRVELQRWIADGRYEPTVVKHTTLLRVWCGGDVPAETIAARVGEHIAQVRLRLAEIGAAADPGSSGAPVAAATVADAVREMVIETLAAEIAAAERLRARLLAIGAPAASAGPTAVVASGHPPPDIGIRG